MTISMFLWKTLLQRWKCSGPYSWSEQVNILLHRKSSSPLPTTSPSTSLADSFASFFHRQNIQTPLLSLTSNPATSSPHSPSPPATPPNFSVFTPASETEVHKILSNCPNKQSDSDPIPTWLLKNVHPFFFPQSPILSTSPSSPASFTPLSRNPLSHLCLRNRHWIKNNSQTIVQSRICLSLPK